MDGPRRCSSEVAGEVQPGRARPLGRTRLRAIRPDRRPEEAVARLSRRLWQRAVPVAAATHADPGGIAARDARVVSAHRNPRRPLGAFSRVVALDRVRAAARRGGRRVDRGQPGGVRASMACAASRPPASADDHSDGVLHLSQPVARLFGRLGFGLAPWRRHTSPTRVSEAADVRDWSEQWRSADERLAELTENGDPAAQASSPVGPAIGISRSRCGLFGAARLLMALEDHPGSTQLVRLRIWSHASRFGLASFVLSAGIAVAAALDGAVVVAALLAVVAAVVGLSVFFETAAAHAVMLSALEDDAAASTGSAEFVNGSARDQDVPNHVVPAGGPSRVGD